jgi:hypothetical protein
MSYKYTFLVLCRYIHVLWSYRMHVVCKVLMVGNMKALGDSNLLNLMLDHWVSRFQRSEGS